MIKLILCVIIFWNTDVQSKYWEQMSNSEKEVVLNAKNLPDIVKQFMEKNKDDKYKDTDQYWKIIDILVNKNTDKQLFPLYFYLFNKECSASDGEIAEMMGAYCQKILLVDPNFVISYLGNNNNLMKKYGDFLGYDLSDDIDSDNSSPYRPYAYKNLKLILQQKVTKEKKASLQKLFEYIDKTIEIMKE